MDWIDYDELHRYWLGQNGGKDPASVYRRFVKAGLKAPVDPRLDRLRDWVYGGEEFLKRALAMAEGKDEGANRRRRTEPVNIDSILKATADEYGVKAEQYCGFRSRAGGRDVAAMLCRRWTGTTLRALSETFGLSHPDSASDVD